MRRFFPLWLLLPAFGSILSACAGPEGPSDPRLSGPSATDLERLEAPRAPLRFAAADAESVRAVVQAAARFAARPDGRFDRVQISAIPYLRRSPEGARFLATPAPRALARGAPEHACPAAGVGADPVSTASAAETALNACFAQLARREAGDECGCRLLAVDHRLTAPAESFVFAPVVSARLFAPGDRRMTLLAAETELADDGSEILLLRDARGVAGRVALAGDTATLRFTDRPDIVYAGPRRPFGYRRGRLAERLTLSAADGSALTLLIGVERRDALPSN